LVVLVVILPPVDHVFILYVFGSVDLCIIIPIFILPPSQGLRLIFFEKSNELKFDHDRNNV
jgi:hypothetical protein